MPRSSLSVRRRRKARAKRVIVVRVDSVKWAVIDVGRYSEKERNIEEEGNENDDGEDERPKASRKSASICESAAIVAGEVLDE